MTFADEPILKQLLETVEAMHHDQQRLSAQVRLLCPFSISKRAEPSSVCLFQQVEQLTQAQKPISPKSALTALPPAVAQTPSESPPKISPMATPASAMANGAVYPHRVILTSKCGCILSVHFVPDYFFFFSHD